MTITEARTILAEDAVGLSDNDIQEIIDWLNMMADTAIDSLEKSHQVIS